MSVRPEGTERPSFSIWNLLRASIFGGALGGLGLVLLTLRINPPAIRQLDPGAALVLLFLALGCGLGALVGLVLSAIVTISKPAMKLVGSSRPATGNSEQVLLWRAATILLAFGPILYVLLLPEAGLTGSFLTDRIAAGGGGLWLSVLALSLVLIGTGLLVRSWCDGRSISATSLALGSGAFLLVLLALSSHSQQAMVTTNMDLPAALAEPNDQPPVVLLCIDGVDPRVLDRLIAQGDLPAFAELRRSGTSGSLASFSPTLSPAIWTTMITGQSPANHGIFGFTRYRLPGIRQAIDRFPVHAGLNFELPKLIEKIPGAPAPRVPYTRFDRSAPTVWQIHQYMSGRRSRSGVFRWRVTWPAENLKGFMVAARVTLGEVQSSRLGLDPSLDFSRPGVQRRVERAGKAARVATEEEAALYRVPGAAELSPEDPRWNVVEKSLDYVALSELSALLERFEPQLLVAGFYSVDAFSHMFWRDARDGGDFAPAIDQRYRFTDARLGELMAQLPAETNLIVTSDHGFDFDHGHHTHAPPGVFLATGPAFARGRIVEGASVYDLAPLVLHLLGLPPGEDMPGTSSYRQLLDEAAAQIEVGTVPSWQGLMATFEDAPSSQVPDAQAPAVLEELRALGYIE